MLHFQQYKKHTFEFNFLSQIKSVVKDSNLKCYFGFDFGFLSGVNIYYGSHKDSKAAYFLYDLFKKENINIRLITNIDYDYDVIVLFGYVNTFWDKLILCKNKSKFMKALSFFL